MLPSVPEITAVVGVLVHRVVSIWARVFGPYPSTSDTWPSTPVSVSRPVAETSWGAPSRSTAKEIG